MLSEIIMIKESRMFFLRKKKKKSPYHTLRKKWTSRHKSVQEQLWARHAESMHWLVNNTRLIGAGSVGGMMLLSSPAAHHLLLAHNPGSTDSAFMNLDASTFLSSDLYSLLPKDEVRSLTAQEENKVAMILSRDFGFAVSASLDGKQLNTTYGYIGAEQHLARYPGDTLYTHFDNAYENAHYADSGMAPGLGAWGYFASSKDEMTSEENMEEKYYVAVQTFLAPGYADDPTGYNNFFKFRKMLVVNPENGRAVVAVIGDAGPAPWTGKQLGGSPEVMEYLQRVDGAQKGPVLYFFIDDKNNTVPLGPVTMHTN